MTFTTLSFVIFLVLVFAFYWVLRRRSWQNVFLLAASYIFYAWWDYRFCALMLLTCLTDFLVSRRLSVTTALRSRQVLLTISVVVDLGILAFFKYFNFFIDSLSYLLTSLGLEAPSWTLRIILPVGISFYTFQSLSYTIDVYRGRLRPTSSLIEFLAFVSFFPQLVAGPIERATNLLPQFQQERTFDHAKAVDGCRQILWGFFKKLYFADRLGDIVEATYAHPADTGGFRLAFATVCFGFQIYCDFSAYSDIAIGSARLLGFDLMRNFACPYFSQDLLEFWRRWHISLSTWFRDYVYFPLGGSRVSPLRHAGNIMVTFVLSGLWHGAAWTYVAWGFLHGAGAVLSTYLRKRPTSHSTDIPGGSAFFPSSGVLLRIVATFLVVNLAWVFFRAHSLTDAGIICSRIASAVADYGSWLDSMQHFSEWDWVIRLGALLAVEWLTRRHPHPLALQRLPRAVRWSIYTVLFWMALTSVELRPSNFIYFQF